MTAVPKTLLIWLPSPLGDAIMATPALRALRALYRDARITFFAADFTRQVLSPSAFCDGWLASGGNLLQTVQRLKFERFDEVILLKNSFSAALAVRLAGIPRRIGYARDGRGWLLSDRLQPLRSASGAYEPVPMVDYYLKIAEFLGATVDNRKPELTVEPKGVTEVKRKLPAVDKAAGPVVILVPGGAFGPSKLWLTERYAQLADKLKAAYHATVILSIAPVPEEIQIAEAICRAADSEVLHIGRTSLSGGELKALFSVADLVIANDTGPRHIAIGLDKNVVSLFGPNNPAWTQTGHDRETQILGRAACVPCDRPVCRQRRHFCMESISVEEVFQAAAAFLEGRR